MPVKDIVTQLEAQLADAKGRLDIALKKSPFDGSVIDEQQDLSTVIEELNLKIAEAKRAVLRKTYGLDKHDERTAGVRPSLRTPSRLFEPGERKKYPTKLNVDDEQSKEFQRISNDIWGADTLERTEDKFQKAFGFYTKDGHDRQVAFSQGIYGAFICMFGLLQREVDAVREFHGLKRRELEARVASLESDRHEVKQAFDNFRYCGVWNANRIYAKGNSVTRGGSLWIAMKDNGLEPGGNDSWQLAVKRGRDGKEMR